MWLGYWGDGRTQDNNRADSDQLYGEAGKTLVRKLVEWLLLAPETELVSLQAKLRVLFEHVKNLNGPKIIYEHREDERKN